MTINTSQGQAFKVVDLDLETECFAYGLYVGCSIEVPIWLHYVGAYMLH